MSFCVEGEVRSVIEMNTPNCVSGNIRDNPDFSTGTNLSIDCSSEFIDLELTPSYQRGLPENRPKAER